MSKILYYDCSAGISGDMNLAALVALGVDFEYLKTELGKLNLSGEFRIERRKVLKCGIVATKIDVTPLDTHAHPRDFAHIRTLIESSNLSSFVKSKSVAIFRTLAVAEAKIHGVAVEKVHFHEVGAIDSIVDIVGAAICLEALGDPVVISSAVELGGGFASCAHGQISVPAPATAEVLRGVSVSLGRGEFEMTTPTGAAILRTCATDFATKPNFKIEKIGYGAGGKDAPNFANALRVMLCESRQTQELVQKLIQTNIDDMDAESFAFACEILRENGALDVFSHSIYMKKGRIGFELNVLCKEQDAQRLKEMIFTHTSAIGVREIEVLKTELKREFVTIPSKFGEIRLKVSQVSEKNFKLKPEFEECRLAAKKHDTTLKAVKKEILKNYDETRNFKKRD